VEEDDRPGNATGDAMAGEIPPARAILAVAGNGAKSDLSEKTGHIPKLHGGDAAV
jgi:hypothetical protein